MNKLLYFGLGLLTGTAVGGLIGKFYFEKKANEKADEEVNEMRRYYEKKYANKEGTCKCGGKCSGEAGVDEQNTAGGRQKPGDDEADDGSRDSKVDYARCYKHGSVETDLKHGIYAENKEDIVMEDGCDPLADDDEEEEDELERETEEIEEIDAEYKRNANRKPRLISGDSLADLSPSIGYECWTYYLESDTMYDEDENKIEDYERFVGEELDRYDFKDPDKGPKVIFVRNFELNKVYEIEKNLGLDPADSAIEEMD